MADSPDVPDPGSEFPRLPDGPIDLEQTLRKLWELASGLYSIVIAQQTAMTSLGPAIKNIQSVQEQTASVVTHQHEILKDVVKVLEEIKGKGKFHNRLRGLPPDWPPATN